MKRETRLSYAFLGSALVGLIAAAVIATPFAQRLMVALSEHGDDSLGEPGARPVMFLGCVGFFLGALFLVERRRRTSARGATTADAELRELAADRARAAGTHAPDRVCVALEGGVAIEDRLDAFARRVERVLIVGAAYLPRNADAELARAIDEQLLALADTGRPSASARARAAYLATSLTNWTSPQSESAPGYSLLFRAIEVVGRAPLWVSTLPFRAALLRAIAERQAATAAVGVVDASARRASRGRTAKDETIATYVRGVLRPLMSVGIFLRDPLAGFDRLQGGQALGDPSTAPRRGRADAVDGLADAYDATLDHVIRARLETCSCAAVSGGKLAETLVARSKHVAVRLALRPKKTGAPARALVALVDGLSAGRGPELVARLEAMVFADVSVFAGLRHNHALSCALQSTLASALVDRGGELVDPFVAQTIAVDFEGERVDVFRIVQEALTRASGAAVLDQWAERLRQPAQAKRVPTAPEKVASEDDAASEIASEGGGEPAADEEPVETHGIAEIRPIELREAPAAVREALAKANARVTRSALYLLLAFALSSVIALPLGYATVVVLHAMAQDDDDGPKRSLPSEVTWGLSIFVATVAVAATSARLPHRPTVQQVPSKRLRRLLDEAIARHDTHGPDFFEIVEDRADFPQVEVVDHAEWLLGGSERQLFVSEALIRKSESAELEEQIDLAFAAVAGTNQLAASLRGRASCVRAMDGRIRGLPDEPSQWWIALATVRASSFVLAKPAVVALNGFETRARGRLAEAIKTYRAGREV